MRLFQDKVEVRRRLLSGKIKSILNRSSPENKETIVLDLGNSKEKTIRGMKKS